MSAQPKSSDDSTARKLFWASAGFYILIAFEFFYMASPFAAYFYSVYGPGMDGLQQFGLSGWTLWFFLPHLVEETRSTLINLAEPVGLILFFAGLAGFAIGAFQVYRAKLKRADAVMGGLYRYIRHPQYLALMVASVGMLLIWPRFLVLFSTCFVFLAYIFLAKAEEGICLRMYDGYADYMAATGRFLPKGWAPFMLPEFSSRLSKLAFGALLFIGLAGGATIAAFGIRSLAINSFYTLETDRGVYLSITRISESELQTVAQVATAAPQVATALESLTSEHRILAYVLPKQMYVSEIPMHLPEGERFGHSVPKDRDSNRYKVIFTKAEFAGKGVPNGKAIISKAVNKYPLIEVQINLASRSVEATFQPPEESYYPDVQVPLF